MTRSGFPGRLLRERRELRGCSLKDAHKHTRVPTEYLKALEEGNLRALPVPAFTTGFIQTYCEFLEVEPEYFVDRYRHAQQQTRQVKQLQTVTASSGETFQLQPRWVIELKSWATVCAVLICMWAAYSVVVKPFFVDTAPRMNADKDDQIVITPPTHFDDN